MPVWKDVSLLISGAELLEHLKHLISGVQLVSYDECFAFRGNGPLLACDASYNLKRPLSPPLPDPQYFIPDSVLTRSVVPRASLQRGERYINIDALSKPEWYHMRLRNGDYFSYEIGCNEGCKCSYHTKSRAKL
ncbi:hypothetical protein B0H13DRAFT_2322792 [Mycena leptocephala]|nr:hypothetical protein B0H13DRAFT_2322792 [Mycena leptocephala]